MNPNNVHPNLSSSFQQALADRPGRQIDGIPGIGVRKLQALNDHYLKDIGLDHSEIVWSVKETIRLDTHWS